MKKTLFLFVLYGVVLLNFFSQNNESLRSRMTSASFNEKNETKKAEDTEDSLAQKNAMLQAKISIINKMILEGKADLNKGNIDSALINFKNAVSQLPLSENEPAYSVSRYSEVASALYEASQCERDPSRKERLVKATAEYVNKVQTVSSNDPVSHFILGMNYADSGDWEKAAIEFEFAVKYDPSNYWYYYQLGRARFRLKNFTAARSAFESSIRYQKKFDLSYFNLGMTCKRLGQNKDALLAFIKARLVNPQNSKAYLEEARILNEVYKDKSNAINCYNQVVSIDPVNKAALNECGIVYSRQRNYVKSENCHRKAMELLLPGDKDPVTYYNLALCLYRQKKYAEAEKYAKISYEQKDAIRNDKVKAVIIWNYALIEKTMKKEVKAMALYKESCMLDNYMKEKPLDVAVKSLEENTKSEEISIYEKIDYEEMVSKSYNDLIDPSVAYFEKNAITDVEEKSLVVFNYAVEEDRIGNFDKAFSLYKEALSLDPQSSKIKAKLGIFFIRTNPIYENLNFSSVWYKDTLENDSELKRILSNACIEHANVCVAQNDVLGADIYFNALKEINSTYENSKIEDILDVSSNSNIKDSFYDKEKLGDKIYKEIHLSENSTISKWVVYSSVDKYDIFGNVIYSKNDSGETVLYNCEYDKKGNLVHCKSNGSTAEEFWNEYDDNGKLIHKKYASGNESWYKYDSSGNQIYEKNDKGDEYFYEYVSDEYWGDYLSHIKGSDGSESYIEYNHTREGYKKHVKSRVNNMNLDVWSEYDSSDCLIHTVFGLGELWYEYEFYPDGTIKTRRTYKTL